MPALLLKSLILRAQSARKIKSAPTQGWILGLGTTSTRRSPGLSEVGFVTGATGCGVSAPKYGVAVETELLELLEAVPDLPEGVDVCRCCP